MPLPHLSGAFLMTRARQYRSGQRWGLRCPLPEFEPELVIGNVLGPPHYRPSEYAIYVRYNLQAAYWIPPGVDGVNLTLTAKGLDRSVTGLLQEGVVLPEWWRFGQQHDLPDRRRAMTSLFCDTVEAGLRGVLRNDQYREEGRRRMAAAGPRDEVLRQLVPWRKAHKRPAWKPVTEPGDGSPRASKFSGTPWLAAGEAWPPCTGCRRPMQLFVQLNLARFPRQLAGQYGRGLLQLFYCSYTESGECRFPGGYEAFRGPKLVRIVQPEGSARRGTPPVPEGHFPPKTITGWKRLDDYPNHQDHEECGLDYRPDFALGTVRVSCGRPNLLFEHQKSIGLAEAISSALPGDKLAGWPCWVQHPEYPKCPVCRRRMESVFQLDSNDNLPYTFGDLGCGHITQCPEPKEVVTFAWACS
jgi:hypothetical protein